MVEVAKRLCTDTTFRSPRFTATTGSATKCGFVPVYKAPVDGRVRASRASGGDEARAQKRQGVEAGESRPARAAAKPAEAGARRPARSPKRK